MDDPMAAPTRTFPARDPLPRASETRDQTKQILSEAVANLRGAFLLADQEGFTRQQVERMTGLRTDTVSRLARDWVIGFRK